MRQLGLNFSDKELKELMKEYDQDGIRRQTNTIKTYHVFIT